MARRAPQISMFHRRLLLLSGAGTLVFGVLTAQLLRLAVLEGAEHRATAESRLERTVWLPTWRGPILDRHGRVLAADEPSYDIAIPMDVITGRWATLRAEAAARDDLGGAWNEMSDEARTAAVTERRPAFEADVERVWRRVRDYAGLTEEAVLERRDEIRRRVQTLAAQVHDAQRRAWEARRAERGAFGQTTFRPEPIAEQVEAHVFLAGVDDEVAFAFQRLALLHEGLVEVRDSTRRRRPHLVQTVVLPRAGLPGHLADDAPLRLTVEGVGDHLLGSVRDRVWAEDVARRPFRDPRSGAIDPGGYMSRDRIGSSGLEASFEDHLRGTRGRIVERRATGEERRVEPAPGADLTLSIDIALQARVQAVLSHEFGLTVVQPWHRNQVLDPGWPLNGAAVVLEVATGEILAAVSMPTLAMAERTDASRRTFDQADVNRPFAGVYPPGSILKPLVLWSAVESGAHDIGTIVPCTGHFFPGEAKRLRCWIYRDYNAYATHEPLGAEEAIARSCNIYFYTAADALGAEGLATWLRRFGLGMRPDVGLLREIRRDDGSTMLAGESAGNVPLPERLRGLREIDRRNRALAMGIGQGDLTWTPLQAADAYARLARGGSAQPPLLVLDDPRPPRSRAETVPLASATRATIVEGLRRSVEDRIGTGHHLPVETDQGPAEHAILNVRGVTVMAKTGTAQAPPLRLDRNLDGEVTPDEYIHDCDHAWFVGLVGPSQSAPLYVVAVVVEYGGSGGRVSGPVANEIIRALQHEGYLPGGDA